MRSFLKHTAYSTIFVAGLALLLLFASWISIPKSTVKDAGIQDPSANGVLNEKENTIDVLILGDSESYCSFIPMKIWEQYGITSYCCGTAAQKLCYSQEFLYKTFENQSPKIVILETDAIFRNFSFSDMLLHKANLAFPVFSYHNRWKSVNASNASFSINHSYLDNTKGYQDATTVEEASTDGYMKETKDLAPVSARNRAYVESIKSYCEEKGAKLVLISTPSTINWNTARHNSIQKMAAELNLEYIDMNLMKKEIPIDWKKDSRDKGDHLNHVGAEKVTAYLGRYLSSTGLLSNHKDDLKYKHWNDQSENINKAISASLSK